MKTIETSIIIKASDEEVWNTLLNFSEYPQWNPFIQEIRRTANDKLQVQIHLADKKPMTFKPIILIEDKAREFRWLGKMFFKGLFDGEHFFRLEKIDSNTTRLIHGESFSGILSRIILRSIQTDTISAFKAMNQALKTRIESQ